MTPESANAAIDPATRMSSWRHLGATLRHAMWIGWQMESNWTSTWVYILYAAVRPMALCMILYYLYMVVSANPATDPTFVSIYVGNAFFTIFVAVAGGVAWVIIQDREHFRIIRYIYMAPSPFWLYILGRALIVLVISLVSLLIIFLFASLALGMPVGFAHIRWHLLLPATVMGIVSAAAMGMIFAGVCLITARHSMMMAEGAGAVFLLTCGVLYPVDAMPMLARWVGMALPMTYWMELVRRAFGGLGFSRVLTGIGDAPLMGVLAALTVAFTASAFWLFRACENNAKRRGVLDQTTNY